MCTTFFLYEAMHKTLNVVCIFSGSVHFSQPTWVSVACPSVNVKVTMFFIYSRVWELLVTLTVDDMSVIVLAPDASPAADPRGCVPRVVRTVAARWTTTTLSQLIRAVRSVHQNHTTSRLNAIYQYLQSSTETMLDTCLSLNVTRVAVALIYAYLPYSLFCIWYQTGTPLSICFITSPPTHSIGSPTSNGRWRLSSSSVGVCNTPRPACRQFIHAGQAMTSCRLQSNYSNTARRASRVTSRWGDTLFTPAFYAICL